MPFVWKPLPGTTGLAKVPTGSVIVNQKKGWELDELEKFSAKYESLKAELKLESLGLRSKDGLKRINKLAKVSSLVHSLYECYCSIYMFTSCLLSLTSPLQKIPHTTI